MRTLTLLPATPPQTNEAFWNSVSHAKPFAVGLNCALGASDMKKYIANLSRCADCYVFCYPNAGLPNAMGGYDQKGPEMAEEIRPFCEDGIVNAIGGCCGTSPEHIAAIRAIAIIITTAVVGGTADVRARFECGGMAE